MYSLIQKNGKNHVRDVSGTTETIGEEVNRMNREEAIKYAKENILAYTSEMAEFKAMAIETLEQTRWIPVTERLPKDGRDVLVTLGHTYEPSYTDYSVARYLFCGENERHWHDERRGYLEWDEYSDGHGGCSLYKVLAWMPLPEPYKAGVSE